MRTTKRKTDHDHKLDLLVDDVIDYCSSFASETPQHEAGCHAKRLELGLTQEDLEVACDKARAVIKQLVARRRHTRASRDWTPVSRRNRTW